MRNIKIILKNGYEIKFKCEIFRVTYDLDTSVSEYVYDGLDENSDEPLHIDLREIAAVIEER